MLLGMLRKQHHHIGEANISYTEGVFHMPSGIFHKSRRDLFHCSRAQEIAPAFGGNQQDPAAAMGSGLEGDDGWLHREWMHFLFPKKVHKETAGEDFDFLPWTPLKTTKALSALGPALIALGV